MAGIEIDETMPSYWDIWLDLSGRNHPLKVVLPAHPPQILKCSPSTTLCRFAASSFSHIQMHIDKDLQRPLKHYLLT